MRRRARSIGIAAILVCPLAPAWGAAEQEAPEVGEFLERIECPGGYRARVFATGLEAPDGLAFDSRGRVCVVEERAGRLTRIEADGGSWSSRTARARTGRSGPATDDTASILGGLAALRRTPGEGTVEALHPVDQSLSMLVGTPKRPWFSNRVNIRRPSGGVRRIRRLESG